MLSTDISCLCSLTPSYAFPLHNSSSAGVPKPLSQWFSFCLLACLFFFLSYCFIFSWQPHFISGKVSDRQLMSQPFLLFPLKPTKLVPENCSSCSQDYLENVQQYRIRTKRGSFAQFGEGIHFFFCSERKMDFGRLLCKALLLFLTALQAEVISHGGRSSLKDQAWFPLTTFVMQVPSCYKLTLLCQSQ